MGSGRRRHPQGDGAARPPGPEQGPRPRDVLAELLWPGHDTEHVRGALRRTLSALRGAVGAGAVDATRDRVALVRGPGLEEYISTRQLVSSLSRGDSGRQSLRDEKLAAALDAHAARVAVPALGEAASAILESTGEPGAGAAAAGTMMSESELQRIIDRAGLTSAPADLHPLAYRDRRGYVHRPLEATVELARAFAAAEPTTVIGYLDDQEEEMRLRGNQPGER
jgi:hypothetical protein